MKNLSENIDVQFVVNPVGKAMVLHRGAFENNYSWAQYEPFSNGIELVTPEGEMHSLGFQISKKMQLAIDKTRELFLVQMDQKNKIVKARLVKFIKLEG